MTKQQAAGMVILALNTMALAVALTLIWEA
jgi:hypothetical protein